MKLNKILVILLLSFSYVLKGQTTIYQDRVEQDLGSFYSSLEQNPGFAGTDKVLNHKSTAFTGAIVISNKVIRNQTGYKDLLPYAYGIVEVNLDASPPSCDVVASTENFGAVVINNSGDISYELSFDPSINAGFMTHKVCARGNANQVSQAAAYPLSGSNSNKIRVHIYDKDGNQASGQHAFSFIAFLP